MSSTITGLDLVMRGKKWLNSMQPWWKRAEMKHEIPFYIEHHYWQLFTRTLTNYFFPHAEIGGAHILLNKKLPKTHTEKWEQPGHERQKESLDFNKIFFVKPDWFKFLPVFFLFILDNLFTTVWFCPSSKVKKHDMTHIDHDRNFTRCNKTYSGAVVGKLLS